MAETSRCARCPAAGRCADCVRYGRLLAAARGEDLPLPSGLAERLCVIARRGQSMDDATSVLERVVAAEREDHRRPAMSASLAEHLRDISRRHNPPRNQPRHESRVRPPRWLAEGRYAVAVCALLTATLLTLAGDTSAHLQQAGSDFETTSQRVAYQAQSLGSALRQSAADSILEAGETGHRQLASAYLAAADRAAQWRAAVVNELSNTRPSRWLDSAFSRRGDDDGRSTAND